MNRTQEKQLDDLVRRFSAERAHRPEPEVPEPEIGPDGEIVKFKPSTVFLLTLLALVFFALLVTF